MKSVLYSFRSLKLSLAVFFSLGMALVAQAQVATLSVQGVLTKSDGTAVDDGNDYVLTFRLWKSESGTAPADKVHQETIENISIVGGVYSVVLGLNPDPQFQLLAPFNQPYWLGVSVGTSSVELLPRPRLTHAPYALGLVGQNNTFPSTGAVICDAINVAGQVNAGSYGNINAGTINSGNVSITGTLSTTGAANVNSLSAAGAVNGNYFVTPGGAPAGSFANRGYTFGSGGDPDGGLFSLADNNVCLYANATKALEATNGGVAIPGYVHAGSSYTFINDDDSGLFTDGNGTISLRANNQGVMFANTSGFNILKDLYLSSAPNMTDGDNLEWRSNVQGGRVGVNTSSRRYKYNIQPLQVDFTRMLKVQPRIYNRKSEGDDKWEIGYIAEEIDSLGMKDLVLYDEQGRPNSLIYKKFVIYTNELVKMQHNEIELLKAQVNTLNKELQQLQAANAGLQGKNNALLEQQTAFSAQLEALSKRISAMEISGTGK